MNKGLGLRKDWAYNIIKSVETGEVYEKYMGFGKEGIGIARKGSPNDLWTRGGLMYSLFSLKISLTLPIGFGRVNYLYKTTTFLLFLALEILGFGYRDYELAFPKKGL